ncbi:MAG: ABC transporter ATP-binding protein [Patescibacteria group bacterium]
MFIYSKVRRTLLGYLIIVRNVLKYTARARVVYDSVEPNAFRKLTYGKVWSAVWKIILAFVWGLFMTWDDPTPSQLLLVLVAYIAGILVYGIVTSLARKRSWAFRRKLTDELDARVIGKFRELDMAGLSTRQFERAVAPTQHEHYQYHNPVERMVELHSELIGATAGFISSLGIIWWIDPWLILLSLAGLVPRVMILLWEKVRERETGPLRWEAADRQELYKNAITNITHNIQARFVGHLDYLIERYNHYRSVVTSAEERASRKDLADAFVRHFSLMLAVSTIAGGLIWQIHKGEISFPEATAIIGSLWSFLGSIATYMGRMLSAKETYTEYRHLEQLWAIKPDLDESHAVDFTAWEAVDIEVSDVHFRYSSAAEEVLRGLSFSIPAGAKIALVGENGSGKTTLLRLLSKIHLPTSGRVLIGGAPTEKITQWSLHTNLASMIQSSTPPILPIGEVLTGESDASEYDPKRLARALAMASADEIVDKLPKKLETIIGKKHYELSVGQAQRIELAAVCYRALNPLVRMVFFDEPSSAMDPWAREKFFNSLVALKGKTVVVILHDEVHLHAFERVILLDNGTQKASYNGPEEIANYAAEVKAERDRRKKQAEEELDS